MLNAEKYKERIEELEYKFALCGDELKCCKSIRCDNCNFYKLDGKPCNLHKIKWLLEEYKEPILDDIERKYLSTVFEPFKEHIKYVQKEIEIYSGYDTTDGEEDEPVTNMAIYIHFLNNTFSGLPFFDEKMFANMENYKDYTLEEFGL